MAVFAGYSLENGAPESFWACTDGLNLAWAFCPHLASYVHVGSYSFPNLSTALRSAVVLLQNNHIYNKHTVDFERTVSISSFPVFSASIQASERVSTITLLWERPMVSDCGSDQSIFSVRFERRIFQGALSVSFSMHSQDITWVTRPCVCSYWIGWAYAGEKRHWQGNGFYEQTTTISATNKSKSLLPFTILASHLFFGTFGNFEWPGELGKK